ncbi:SGNH/GDSL hydrolase family protein [Pseudoxanthomonas mexicana]
MSRRLSFAEFDLAIKSGTMPIELLPDYLELDKSCPVPILKFRSDALTTDPPASYDVDKEVYDYTRRLQEAEERRIEEFAFSSKRSVLIEGDSWFNLPPVVRPRSIGEHLKGSKNFGVKNIAKWGHTANQIVKAKEYLSKLQNTSYKYFLLSAGGNDLQLGLASGEFLRDFSEGLDLKDYLKPEALDALNEIKLDYAEILNEVRAASPATKIICYGYDHPRPKVGEGEYIGRYLRRHGVPENLLEPLSAYIVERLGETIKEAAEAAGVTYLSCLTVTKGYTWFDDMHPGDEGFRALASKFESLMMSLDSA